MFKRSLIFAAILLAVNACRGQDARKPIYYEVQRDSTKTQSDVTNSRVNAIVLASKKVAPAVVSITVIQERVVTAEPFMDPFFDDFFRDFFPRQQYRQRIQSMGSGVVTSPDGYIITNSHVVENATTIKVILPDSRQFDGKVVGIDEVMDIALVKIPGKNLPYAVLGNSDDLMIGEWAIALGNPFGFLLEDTQPSVTVGVISALRRQIKSARGQEKIYKDMIQTDAAINPGNSGGPLVSADGDVIGINTFIFTSGGGSEGVGFARPINDVKRFIQVASEKGLKLPEGMQTKTESAPVTVTNLGISVADITAGLKSKYGLRANSGAVVVGIEPDSFAANAGIEEGDVIVSLNNQKIGSAGEFKARAAKMTNRFQMTLDRQGQMINLIYQF
jgi:serine protease Do